MTINVQTGTGTPVAATAPQLLQIKTDLALDQVKNVASPAIVGLIADDPTKATANTAIALAALATGGQKWFLTPGRVYFDQVLTYQSFSDIYLGQGFEAYVKDGANCGLFTNRAARLAGIAVTNTNALWENLGNDYVVRIINTAGIEIANPLGSWVSVVCRTHLTGVNGRVFRGVYQVVATAANSITYLIPRRTPGNGGSANPPVNLIVYSADTNISITGPGKINGNGANQTLYGVGDPRGNVIWTRHANDVRIEGPYFKRGITWTIGSNCVRDYRVIGCRGDTTGGVTGDFIHLSGGHQQVRIRGNVASSSDNVVGLTIDITDDPANTTYYPTFNFPYQDPGDMIDVKVQQNDGYTSGLPAICAIYGPPTYYYEDIVFDDVGGQGSSSLQSANYAQTGMTQVTGTRITLRNLRANATGQQMIFTGAQVWDSVILESALHGINLVNEAASFGTLSGSGNIGELIIRGVLPNTAADRSGPLVTTTGALNIGHLRIEDMEEQRYGAGVPVHQHTGTGTIGKITHTRVSAVAATGGANNALSLITGTGQVGTVKFNGSRLTSQGQLGALLVQGASANITNVVFNDSEASGAGGLFVGNNSATATAVNVFMNSVTLGAAQCARAAVFAGPTNLFVNGYQELTAPAANPFQCLTAGKAYNFRMENVGRDADSITKTGGTLRLHGGGARTAIANVDAPQAGDLVFNLTASVRVARNIANSAWVNLHT